MLYRNPDLYDELLPASEAQLQCYVALAERHPGAVLELGCGSGQLLVRIAATSSTAIGLDNSAEMLAAARQRALRTGVSLDLIHGDMRNFELGRKFSLIFVARNSLLHLSEQEEYTGFFSAVRHHLAPDGILAFDVFNPDVRLLSRSSGRRFPVMRKPSERHGELTVEETVDYDSASQVNRGTWFVSTSTQRDAWVAPLHLRSIFPQELLAVLAANALRLVQRDGDYAGGAFTAASRQQVCTCRPI